MTVMGDGWCWWANSPLFAQISPKSEVAVALVLPWWQAEKPLGTGLYCSQEETLPAAVTGGVTPYLGKHDIDTSLQTTAIPLLPSSGCACAFFPGPEEAWRREAAATFSGFPLFCAGSPQGEGRKQTGSVLRCCCVLAGWYLLSFLEAFFKRDSVEAGRHGWHLAWTDRWVGATCCAAVHA